MFKNKGVKFMISFDLELFKKISTDIFTCDSPTGFTHNVIRIIEDYVKQYGYDYRILNNGALEVSIKGKDSSKVVATSAHVDT